MEQNKQKNSRKRLNSLILLVAFTAIMLIVSTYAWFSTQKNVTLGGLQGKVNVAEGLQISLNAYDWANSIDLSEAGIAAYFAQSNADFGKNYDLTTPYLGRTNLVPKELLPASTTAQDTEGIGLTDFNMYRGENTDGIKLSNIAQLPLEDKSGYYAIDFFLQNSSSEDAITDNVADIIRLEPNSEITLDGGLTKESTGLQNTLRVGFALFDNAGGNANDVLVSATPSQEQILNATNEQNIIDAAIWEPNARGDQVDDGQNPPAVIEKYAAHVNYIVANNNNIKWTAADAQKYFSKTITDGAVVKFKAGDGIPTFALTQLSIKGDEVDDEDNPGNKIDTKVISNIYDWATPSRGLVKQNTLQTPNTGVGEDPISLKSVTDGTTDFSMAPGEYHKLRMYVWLEGQDVDCINYASLGGGLTIDVGLSKPGSTTDVVPGS